MSHYTLYIIIIMHACTAEVILVLIVYTSDYVINVSF